MDGPYPKGAMDGGSDCFRLIVVYVEVEARSCLRFLGVDLWMVRSRE